MPLIKDCNWRLFFLWLAFFGRSFSNGSPHSGCFFHQTSNIFFRWCGSNICHSAPLHHIHYGITQKCHGCDRCFRCLFMLLIKWEHIDLAPPPPPPNAATNNQCQKLMKKKITEIIEIAAQFLYKCCWCELVNFLCVLGFFCRPAELRLECSMCCDGLSIFPFRNLPAPAVLSLSTPSVASSNSPVVFFLRRLSQRPGCH